MQLFRSVEIVLISIFLLLPSVSWAEYPGVTPGSFSVNDSGAANYSMPISVPAGVAGMNPELAVTYNSQGGNGLMGVGFGLSGFTSMIHRCGSSHATDGHASGVHYNHYDKLCLDGQRLILAQGNHWQNGAIYRTEMESFSKIMYEKYTNSAGTNLDRFIVYGSDGEKRIFNWNDLRWRGGTDYISLSWRLSSVQDRSGNSIQYNYQHLNGQAFLPKEVIWTGNGSTPGNRKAVFEYSIKAEKRFAFEDGIKRENKYAIKGIKTYIGANLVKEYRFGYQNSPNSQLTRLWYVQQCGSDGGCLPRHEFTWNDTTNGFTLNTPYQLPVRVYDYQDIWVSDGQNGGCAACGYNVEVKRGDFLDINNDGYVDFIESYRSEDSSASVRNIYKNTGSGWVRIAQLPPIITRDYYINRNKSSSRGEMVQHAIYADVNGDGYPDIIRAVQNGSSFVREVRLNNNGNFTWGAPSLNNFVPPWAMVTHNLLDDGKPMQISHLVDVNGDGLPDWVGSYYDRNGNGIRKTWINDGSRWVYSPNWNLPDGAYILDYRDAQNMDNDPVKRTEFVDINGDGLVDLVQGLLSPHRGIDAGKSYRNVWINTGTGWQVFNHYQLPDYINDYTRADNIINGQNLGDAIQRRGDFIDVNGDGLVDWVRSYKDFLTGVEYNNTWLNTGKGWVIDPNYALVGAVMRNYSAAAGGDPHGPPSGSFFDINRDGLVDWVVAYRDRDRNTVKQTFLNTGQGWGNDTAQFHFPNILVDNEMNENNTPMHFGGLMDLNGDGAVDYLMSTKNLLGGNHVATYLGNAKPADMLVGIIDSLGSETSIAYKSMMDTTVYNFIASSSPAPSYRNRKVIGPMPLVSDTWQSDGVSGNYHLQYFYFNALSDGRHGYLGFYQRHVWDPNQKILSVNRNYQNFPVTGMSRESFAYKADDVNAIGNPVGNVESLHYQSNFIKEVSTFTQQGDIAETQDRIAQPSGKFTYAPKIRRTRSVEYELGLGQIRENWTNTVYDAFNNPTTVTAVVQPNYTPYESIDFQNSFWTKTDVDYKNDTTNWLIGLPELTTVTHHAPGQVDQIRETQIVYNPTTGLPEQTIIEPNRSEFRLTTTHSYDGFGNEVSTTVSGQNIDPRTSIINYDQAGMHIISKINALGHTASETHHARCDAAETVTDVNGLVTTMSYDEFCRLVRTDYPDGTWSTTDYSLNPLMITSRAKGQPDVITYFDSLGREIRTQTKGFDGRTVIAEKRYNSKGQITLESVPYYQDETVYWTNYYYDVIGRLERTRSPDGSDTTISYSGLTTTMTNAKNQNQTRVVDITGRLKQVIDHDNNAITYDYDAVGNLLSTTDPMGNQVTMDYDHAGRKIWMDDPNMGYWTYDYDVLGQLIKQTDAKTQEITTEYDLLGRMTKRTTKRTVQGTTEEQISSWEYDTAANGIGQLYETIGPNYKRRHAYDDRSRPSRVFEWINGMMMTSYQRYDSNGRIRETRYPGRNTVGIPGYLNRIFYDYNAQGYLSSVRNVSNIDGDHINETLWSAEAMDAKGNITQEHYGNGVSVRRNYHATRNYLENIHSFTGSGLYVSPPCPEGNNCPTELIFDGEHIQNLSYSMDAIGNLTQRADSIMNAVETFSYDNLNRLTQSTTTPGDLTQSTYSVDYDYDVLGNITYRSDVGIMNYGENGYGPHAITSIQQNSSVNVTENVFNPYGAYSYDLNGNLTSNGQRTVSWTAFNKPEQMAAMIDGEARGVTYTYGSDFQRITKSTLAGKLTRYYGGGSMEHIQDAGQTFWKYYIPVGAATLQIKYEQLGSTNIYQSSYEEIERQYLFKDHLGSTDVIVDNDGNIVERLSFNPWGERRDADWTEADGEITSSSNRGFTGHEMDDEIGLINMNARIYDPVIGRFLSPDALIPSPTDLQSYNRYSYVRNNPLSFTDPTGFARVPGSGGYHYDGGRFYQLRERCVARCYEGKGWRDSATWTYDRVYVTDPGLINQLKARIGVANEIVKNYGGLTKGNAKDYRNQARDRARKAIGCAECSIKFLHTLRGHSPEFDAALDQEIAASDLYLWLKRKARKARIKKYAGIALQLAAPWAKIPLPAASAASAGLNGGDLGDILKAAVGAHINTQALGAVGGALAGGDISSLTAITAHGVVGGIVAEIQGGGFAEGFAAGAVGKGITIGTGGSLVGTVAAGALVAELVGGDPLLGAIQAYNGYMYNYSVNQIAGIKIGHDAVRCSCDRPPSDDSFGIDGNVNHGFQSPFWLVGKIAGALGILPPLTGVATGIGIVNSAAESILTGKSDTSNGVIAGQVVEQTLKHFHVPPNIAGSVGSATSLGF